MEEGCFLFTLRRLSIRTQQHASRIFFTGIAVAPRARHRGERSRPASSVPSEGFSLSTFLIPESYLCAYNGTSLVPLLLHHAPSSIALPLDVPFRLLFATRDFRAGNFWTRIVPEFSRRATKRRGFVDDIALYCSTVVECHRSQVSVRFFQTCLSK